MIARDIADAAPLAPLNGCLYHAGTFGPSDYDNTFGPEVRFAKHPEPGQANLPPSDGMQFFGKVDIAADTGVMTVRLMDSADVELWSVDLDPQTV